LSNIRAASHGNSPEQIKAAYNGSAPRINSEIDQCATRRKYNVRNRGAVPDVETRHVTQTPQGRYNL